MLFSGMWAPMGAARLHATSKVVVEIRTTHDHH
jgi:hypothetical protein